MLRQFLAAVVQMNSGGDRAANLAEAQRLVESAARDGARLVVLPEMFDHFCASETMVAEAEPIPGPTSEAMSALAARLGVVLVAGSIYERIGDSVPDGKTRVANTSLVFSESGQQIAQYRKLHLFDVDLPGGGSVRESQYVTAGDATSVADTSCGRLGQTICYDLRFAALFDTLSEAGCECIALPAAFTLATGRDHWEVLLRARAIETQSYILASDQWGHHPDHPDSYGHSLIVDPWGTVLARVADGVGVALAPIDLDRADEIRARLPVRRHRCPIPRPSDRNQRTRKG
jgi:predicted amidohydrolase